MVGCFSRFFLQFVCFLFFFSASANVPVQHYPENIPAVQEEMKNAEQSRAFEVWDVLCDCSSFWFAFFLLVLYVPAGLWCLLCFGLFGLFHVIA